MLLKSSWGSSFTYNLQTMFAKLSVLVFYRRVLGNHGWFRLGVDVTIGFVVLLGIASELVLFVNCRPLRYSWDKTIPDGYCWDIVLWYYINAGMNIALDVVITGLPLSPLFQLQISKRQKIALCGIFSLGGLVCAIGVFRVFQLPALHNSKDISWDLTNAMIWYFVEAALIVIAASGPALRPFFHCYMPTLIGRSRGNHGGSASYGIGESHDMQRSQISTNVSAGGGTGYGKGDSIINEESGIRKTTELAWKVENIPRPQDGENGRWESWAP
ncbi:hypothetical protein B9Z19DRAFT_1121852 [Tuber borchii]|uniref:Rhodopsin domain-containing protein n=1 Tax=Tuber borchii TaxID=42251 RepID=A0A2T7A1V7_TUBBO|nr:hypothetical protein B9Z19DRAFT_1121852 [Tuber borchii]